MLRLSIVSRVIWGCFPLVAYSKVLMLLAYAVYEEPSHNEPLLILILTFDAVRPTFMKLTPGVDFINY